MRPNCDGLATGKSFLFQKTDSTSPGDPELHPTNDHD